jgi:hypothetical protein
LRGEVFRSLLAARCVDLRGQTVEDHGAAIEQERRPLLVGPGIVVPIGIHHVPTRAEDGQHSTEIVQVVAQLHERHEIELAQDFRDVVDGGLGAALLAEFADVPDDVDRLVKLGRRYFCVGNALLESEKALRELRGHVSMVHRALQIRSCGVEKDRSCR